MHISVEPQAQKTNQLVNSKNYCYCYEAI